MGRYAVLVRELADRLRQKDIDSVVYFHTDHFEPWRSVGETPAVGPEVVDEISEFCHVTGRIDFARRLTLFYKPHLNYALRRDDSLLRVGPDDLVGFLPRTENEERFCRMAVQDILQSSQHDLQLHIHHEYYTANEGHTNPEARAWFAGPLGHALDERRLELAIRLNREIMERETGVSPARWFFVHGQWSLNGSDRSACTIDNEIAILQRNGCLGDFTFPAGRIHVNPRIEVPYLCRPVAKPKGYDLAEAEPEIACGNAAAAASKFFIWSSPAKSFHCSLDYISESSRRWLENTEVAARELIAHAYIADRRLFIKTHAHSMHAYYFEHARTPVFPHQLPTVQALLSVIFDAATTARLDVEYLTAPEVYDRLIGARIKPEADLSGADEPSPAPVRRIPQAEAIKKRGGSTVAPMKAKPLGGGRAVELVRETTAGVLRQRIDALGVDGSGAKAHYENQLRQGYPIPEYELAVRNIVRQQLPPLAAYHEIGSGLGTLSFLLALDGLASAAIEKDHNRHATATVIWNELCDKAGVPESSCRLIYGAFPSAVRDEDRSQAAAIITDFVTTQTPSQVDAILAGLRHYPYVLIDLRRFCIIREADAQLDLLARICELGFTVLGEMTKSSDFSFVVLRNDAVLSFKKRPALWSRLKRGWTADRSVTIAQGPSSRLP